MYIIIGLPKLKRKVLTMRKFLAVLMTVLMLVSVVAVLPVSAADEERVSAIDGTKESDANGISLVVTEFMGNTTCSLQVGATNMSSYDAFQYIEIYNRGNSSINLYDLCVLISDDTYASSTWRTEHKFTAKMSLKSGIITTGVDGVDATQHAKGCANPSVANVAPGEFAVIWFVTDKTYEAHANAMGPANDNGKLVYHKTFRDHYRTANSDVEISDDLLIVAVHAGTVTSTTAPTFNLSSFSARMYALADNSFDFTAESAYILQNGVSTWAEEIYCTFNWGTGKGGLINGTSSGFEGVASIYVPANATPDLYNHDQKAFLEEGETYTDAKDYVEIEYVEGYKELAIIAAWEKPTIGTMDAAQWIYVDEARAAEHFANGDDTGAWKTTAINAFLTDRAAELDESEANTEPDRVIIFKPRDELGNKGQNKKPAAADDNKGFPTWALILIIVGGVVLLGGAAAVVIIILKKKNKPVAADDVAAEGEVVVIDETEAAEATEDAPEAEKTEE